jgi:uncharacterized protein (DUF1330 family)
MEASHGRALRTLNGRVVSIEGAPAPKNVGIVEWNSVDDAVAFYKSKAWTDLAPQREKAQKTIRRYVVEVESSLHSEPGCGNRSPPDADANYKRGRLIGAASSHRLIFPSVWSFVCVDKALKTSARMVTRSDHGISCLGKRIRSSRPPPLSQ